MASCHSCSLSSTVRTLRRPLLVSSSLTSPMSSDERRPSPAAFSLVMLTCMWTSATSTHAMRFISLFDDFGIQEQIRLPAHKKGHQFDFNIIRTDHPVSTISVDPPLMCDHSFIFASIDVIGGRQTEMQQSCGVNLVHSMPTSSLRRDRGWSCFRLVKSPSCLIAKTPRSATLSIRWLLCGRGRPRPG